MLSSSVVVHFVIIEQVPWSCYGRPSYLRNYPFKNEKLTQSWTAGLQDMKVKMLYLRSNILFFSLLQC